MFARERSVAILATLIVVLPAFTVVSTERANATTSTSSVVRTVSSQDASGSGSLLGTQIGANVRYGSPPRDATTCTWRRVVDTDSLTGVYGPISRKMGDDMYSLIERRCDGPPPTSRQFWVRDDSNESLAAHASQKVVDDLPAPVYGLAPTAGQLVVNVGTWFWISPTVWKPVSVTAYLVTPEGVVWVTTTATPSRVTYSPGDGSGRRAVCNGPGRRWQPTFGDQLTSSCMYTYAHASNGSLRTTFTARVGIEWRVSWKSNLGVQGVLPTVRTTVPVSVRVHEIQALTTN